MMGQSLPIAQMRSILADAVDLVGGQHEWARRNGIAQSVVSETIAGKREPSEAIINALGYVVRQVCIPMRGQNA